MLILPIHVTHNLLTHTVVSFTVTHSRDASGRPVVVQGSDFNITDANLQPASDRLIALLPEGAQADGTLVMHTRLTLFEATNVNGSASGAQSYVRHNGDIWKVWGIQNWKPHAVIGRYLLTRYVNIDGSIT